MRKVKNKHSKPWSEGWKCWLVQTQSTLISHSFYSLRTALRSYLSKRALNFGPLDDVLNECICAAMARENKGSKTHCEDTDAIQQHPEELARRAADSDPRGPHGIKRGNPGADGWAWRQLHLKAADGVLDKPFIDGFLGKISCGVCSVHARQFVRLNPPPYGESKDEQFRYTWFWHDHIDQQNKLARITLEEARALYHLD